MNFEAIPCIDCITYSACRALRNSHPENIPGYIFIYQLTMKCSIIDKFLDKKTAHDLFRHRLEILEDFYDCGKS